MTFADFIERWICCGRIDDESVVWDLSAVRENNDCLAESFVAYTHDPTEKHYSNRAPLRVNVDNGDLVEDVYDVEVATAAQHDTMVVAVSEKKDGDSPSPVPAPEGAEVVVTAEPIPESGPTSVYRICQDVVEVTRHRRLPHRHNGHYAAAVVSEIKNRLGCPAANAANLLVVRRMANNIIGKHGLRPSHVREVIELVVAGVFVPDESDLRGAKVLASVGISELRSELANAGPTSAWYDLFHPFKNRGAQRVRGSV